MIARLRCWFLGHDRIQERTGSFGLQWPCVRCGHVVQGLQQPPVGAGKVVEQQAIGAAAARRSRRDHRRLRFRRVK
jgi:hypothetical protein